MAENKRQALIGHIRDYLEQNEAYVRQIQTMAESGAMSAAAAEQALSQAATEHDRLQAAADALAAGQ